METGEGMRETDNKKELGEEEEEEEKGIEEKTSDT